MAMHLTVDAPATDTTLPETRLTLTRNRAAYIRKHGTARAERWMSWPTDTERTLKLRTTSLEEHANGTSGYAPTTTEARTGIQHISPQRTEAGRQTGTGTTPAQTEAPSRGSGHLGPAGQTAQTGTKSGPSTATAGSTTEAKGRPFPILHASGTCRHAPRIARRRGSTGGIRSHA